MRIPLHLEEWLNSITHGLGALLSLVGLVALLGQPSIRETRGGFSAFLCMGYPWWLCIWLPHCITAFAAQNVRQDSKPLIIVPFTCWLQAVIRLSCWSVFAARWVGVFCCCMGLALFRVMMKLRYPTRFKGLRVGTYILMGWLALFAGQSWRHLWLPRDFGFCS